jgi:hypothetical protein
LNVTARTGRAAFVIPHPYVDALACFREPIKRLADQGWQVDLFTTLSPMHPAPAFNRENVRLVPIEVTRLGAARLVAALVRNRPKYDWLFAVPQWSLHYTGVAASLASIPMVCISDELKTEEEATSDGLKRWKHRERRAHQKCAFTIALSDPRAAFIRDEDRLGLDHPIVTVPNAAPGPARRLVSHYYQDVLGIPCDKRILLHAGSWWWKRQFAEIEGVARGWGESNVLVFQGRIQNHFPEPAPHPNLRFNSTVLPSDLLDYAVSSAHIGLALYDTTIANNRLMGTASGKITLYMKNMLPVIATANPSFDWIEREGCGVCVNELAEVGPAMDRILADYDRYRVGVKRFYDDRLDFARTFTPVLARMNGH